MPDLVITYTFRSPCACCAVVAQEDVEYSGPHDLEGRHTFNRRGRVPRACFLIVCSACLARLGRCRVRDDCPVRPPL